LDQVWNQVWNQVWDQVWLPARGSDTQSDRR
jgi:hypothetical protein